MKFLKLGVIKLSDDIIHVVHTLEDNYEYPKLDVKLEYFRKRLLIFRDHKPTFDSEVTENKLDYTYSLSLNCGKALEVLENITAEDNVFEIIDNLRTVDQLLNYSLPEPEEIDKFFDMMMLMKEDEFF